MLHSGNDDDETVAWEDAECLRDSCNRLESWIETENNRRLSLEKKAVTSSMFALAFAAFFVEVAGSAELGSGHCKWLVIPAFICCAIVVGYTYGALAISKYESRNPGVLADADVLGQTVEVYYLGYLYHMRDVIKEDKKPLKAKGVCARKAQQWAILSAGFFATAYLVRVF